MNFKNIFFNKLNQLDNSFSKEDIEKLLSLVNLPPNPENLFQELRRLVQGTNQGDYPSKIK